MSLLVGACALAFVLCWIYVLMRATSVASTGTRNRRFKAIPGGKPGAPDRGGAGRKVLRAPGVVQTPSSTRLRIVPRGD